MPFQIHSSLWLLLDTELSTGVKMGVSPRPALGEVLSLAGGRWRRGRWRLVGILNAETRYGVAKGSHRIGLKWGMRDLT